MNRRTPTLLALLVSSGISCANEEKVSQQWDDYVDEHNSCAAPSDCAVIYPGCPLGCWAAVSSDSVGEAQAKAQQLIDRYERGGRSCAYGCVSTGEVTCEAGRCTVGESLNADPGDPCADSTCGDSCTTCLGNNCPAVEEYCDADGVCSSSQPTCSVEAPCEDAGGTCTPIGSCSPTEGHLSDASCDGNSTVCCMALDSCSGAEPSCTDGSACFRPFCIDGVFSCADGQTEGTCG